ncbi:unnamed protein product [Ambrosiozyma monospora]|uniref:Unnamed protein product n=1 Tax=Ambrosiozyma monospora TaxID=43982 RepID=A0ACB5TXY4_AMBMO|nr:unnamed protein product [Ambrosiozyma monospora]
MQEEINSLKHLQQWKGNSSNHAPPSNFPHSQLYFLDAPAGYGKTFLELACMDQLKLQILFQSNQLKKMEIKKIKMNQLMKPKFISVEDT